jgi:hypothetical protein
MKKGVHKHAAAKGISLFLDSIGVGNSGGQEWNEEESCLVCRDRARRRWVCSVNVRVGWVECAELHQLELLFDPGRRFSSNLIGSL